jgi:GxxExxY protein
MIFRELTEKVIGCAMTVHSTLGNGYPEKIYQKALAIELRYNNVQFVEEKEMDVYYRNEKIGKRRVDFLIENNITLEIKAVSVLEDSHLNQAINYLEALNLPIGLLINFGSKSLTFKRVHNNKLLK